MSIKDSINTGDLSQLTTYQTGALQASTNRILQKHCDQILSQFGITKMHWLIIGAAMDGGKNGVRLTDLSEDLNTTMSYLTNTINLLESKGMLKRKDNSADKRSKFISIDKDFIPKCTEIENTLRNALRHSIYSHIDREDFRVYLKVLFQLSNIEKATGKK